MTVTFTKADVIAYPAPELATGVTDPEWTAIIDEVSAQVDAIGWGSQARANQGGKWLAAHLATKLKESKAGAGGSSGPAGPLTSVTVGQVTKTFASPSSSGSGGSSTDPLASTSYGREYMRLRRLFCIRMAVT